MTSGTVRWTMILALGGAQSYLFTQQIPGAPETFETVALVSIVAYVISAFSVCHDLGCGLLEKVHRWIFAVVVGCLIVMNTLLWMLQSGCVRLGPSDTLMMSAMFFWPALLAELLVRSHKPSEPLTSTDFQDADRPAAYD